MARTEIWYGRISQKYVVKYETWESICDWGQGEHYPYCCKEIIYRYNPRRNERGGITKWEEAKTRFKSMQHGEMARFEQYMGLNRFQREWPSYETPPVLTAKAYIRLMEGRKC